jgi:hypothetical protein
MVTLKSQTITHVCAVVLFIFTITAPIAGQDSSKPSYGLLLDSTGSMRSQFETVLNIGKAVVHDAAPHGPVSIFNFASEGIGRGSKAVPVSRIQQSQDEATLNRTIDGMYVEGGQTALLDAIQFISDRLQEWSPDTDKVIVVVSDGEDRVSRVKSKDLIQQLKERKIKVFAVGLVRDLESGKRGKAQKLLTTLARETGGVVVIPESKDVDIQKVLAALGLSG